MYASVIEIIIIIINVTITIMIMTMTMIITIIIIMIIIINTFDAFEVNFLTIYKIENVQKIWVENKESCGRARYIYWPSAFTWYDISL